MRILDRYEARQLIPVWIWCLVVFIVISIFIDLFEHLDEILRYAIPVSTIAHYYLSFVPMIFVQACPLALLFSTGFVATRFVRHQELLAMNAGGLSRLRASAPFLFVGWLAAVAVFFVNDRIVPHSTAVYQQLRDESFRRRPSDQSIENVATMDTANRLYHARKVDPIHGEIADLTVLEHDARNKPRRSLYASRARFVDGGLELFDGSVTRMNATGLLENNPEPFVERMLSVPVTLKSFQNPDTQLETLSFSELRSLIERLRGIGITNVRRQAVELASRITLPLMNVVVCLIGFVGTTKPSSRGRLPELGISLGLGIAYYLGVAASQGLGKEGLLPILVAVLAPHVIAVGVCWHALWQRD